MPSKPGTRRGNNEGCIGKRRPDGRVPGYVSLPGGRRRWFYGRTEREVKQQVRGLLRDLDRGCPPPAKQTVAAFFTRWLETKKRTKKVGESTLVRYEEVVRRHVVPRLGWRNLAGVTPADLQRLYADLLDDGLSAATVHKVHSVIHNALGQAVRWEELPRNVAVLAEPPKPGAPEKRALSPDQVGRLLRAARGDRLEALYWLAMCTGLREGELFGLRWSDLDLDRGRVSVTHKVRRVAKLGIREDGPKTRAGVRTVTLPGVAVRALREHRARQDAERAAYKPGWRETERVFCNTSGGFLEAGNFRLRSWLPLLERAGLLLDPPLVFHEATRHGHASLMVKLGADVKTVQARLGHSRASVTLDLYTHEVTGDSDDAARRLDALLRSVV